MAIVDIFSKRKNRALGQASDVFVYDKLPQPFKVQIVLIIKDAIGFDKGSQAWAKSAYQHIHDILCREYGVFALSASSEYDKQKALFEYFLQEKDIDNALNVIELSMQVIDTYVRGENYEYYTQREISPDDAISELNARFKEHGVGYQFESGEVIRVDSQLVHAEVVKPVLTLLRHPMYKGANEEFLKAHEHYRHGRHKECLVEALKAFESTMKAICAKRKWTFQATDSAKNLIEICLQKGLVPQHYQAQFTSIRALLESGTPVVRNKHGGHGQGPEPIEVPEYLARYGLNLAATNILFLAEADEHL